MTCRRSGRVILYRTNMTDGITQGKDRWDYIVQDKEERWDYKGICGKAGLHKQP
jgi:hypothetical protein